MKKRFRTSTLELPLNKNESEEANLEALKRERERLLKALERTRNKKQNLQKKTSRLLANAKSLDCILARSHREPEYLKREE